MPPFSLHRSLYPSLAAFFVACGGDSDVPEAVVTDSAGVQIVSSSAEDRPLPWSAERVLEIAPVEDDHGGFYSVRDVDVIPGGRIVVLDGDGKKVVLFDGQGRFLKQYGQEGSGPGEFQFPLELISAPDGGVLVFDMMNRRLERFDSTLTPLAPDPLTMEYFGGHMDFAGDLLVLPTANPNGEGPGDQVLKAVSATDTVEILEHRQELTGQIQLESCGMRFSGMAPIFAPSLQWGAGSEGWVAVARTGGYELDLFRAPDFRMVRRIRRSVPLVRATAEMAQATVGDGMRVMTSAGERVCDPGEVVDERGFAEQVPPITGIAVSPRGEIYLERWAPEGEERAVDVLNTDGDYLGTLPPGFPFPMAFLGDDRIVLRQEGELGLTSVLVYRIHRGS